MPPSIIVWPHKVLVPGQLMANPVAFSRSGGRSIGGMERTVRTDKGYWSIAYRDVSLFHSNQRRAWQAIRNKLGGRAGLIAVPVWSLDSMPWALSGGYTTAPHSDSSPFSDGSKYRQRTVLVDMAVAAAIGDTVVTLRLVHGSDDLVGVRFSYQHALYETGVAIEIVDDEWQVSIFPAIRAPIPADAELECDMPTCLCHLADDRAMDLTLSPASIDRAPVSFVEATDYWNDLAAAV